MSIVRVTRHRDESVAFGHELGGLLAAGDVVLLHGDLGSGKTTIAQGMLAALGVNGPVPSPTFTLINEYSGQTSAGVPVAISHLDLYRLHDDADLDSIGLDDYLAPADGISLIEWPERAIGHLDGEFLLIDITAAGESQRRLRLSALPESSTRFAWLISLAHSESTEPGGDRG